MRYRRVLVETVTTKELKMSMIGNFRLVQPTQLEALLEEPEGINDFLYEETEVDGDAPDPGGMLDVDKAWHGLHFLFTGTAWEGSPPLNFIVAGGTEIGDVDVGYGPARAFTNAEVRNIARSLESITADDLRSRFDPKKMTALEIYPEIWNRPPQEDDTIGYLLEYFELLKPFIVKGASEGFGLIVFLN